DPNCQGAVPVLLGLSRDTEKAARRSAWWRIGKFTGDALVRRARLGKGDYELLKVYLQEFQTLDSVTASRRMIAEMGLQRLGPKGRQCLEAYEKVLKVREKAGPK